VHPVLEIGATDRGRALRPERQLIVTTVEERVHLFLDDVGALTDGADEDRRAFEDWGIDTAIVEPACDFTSGVPDPIPIRLIVGEDVRGAARCAV
jgi:hypothetical protein